MKNRLQFNRIPKLFRAEDILSAGTTTHVSGREKAYEALSAYTTQRDFIPLIGEPIVARYIDDKGKKQAILAIGKATGKTENDVFGVEYHIIDTAKLGEEVDLANANAAEALELASAATKDVANYLVILKNMIGENGVELEDGSYFDTDDPSRCGLYKPYDTSNFLGEAKSFRDADFILDTELGNTNVALMDLSGATNELSGTTQEYFQNIIKAAGLNDGTPGAYPGHDETRYIKDASSLDHADVLLDAAISGVSDTVDELSGLTSNIIEAVGLDENGKYVQVTGSTYIRDAENVKDADRLLDAALVDLSANTRAADLALEEKVAALESTSGVDAIKVAMSGTDKTISLALVRGEKVLTQDMYGLKTNIDLYYSKNEKKIYLLGAEDEQGSRKVISEVDASDFIKDGMLDHVNVFVATEEDHREYPQLVVGETYLALYFNTDAVSGGTVSPAFISVKDLVDVYTVSATSLAYLTIEGYEIRANVEDESYPDSLASYNSFKTLCGITENILAGTGLNTQEPGEYHGHDETHYIKSAKTLDNADVLLDAALWALSGVVADIEGGGEAEELVRQLSGVTREFSGTTYRQIMELSARTFDPTEIYEYVDNSISELSGNVIDYVNESIDELSGNVIDYVNESIEELSGNVLDYVNEVEEVTAAALNVLNDRVSTVETHMTGEYIPLTNYEIASGSTQEELEIDDDDTVNEAFGKIQKQVLDNEEVTAAALNNLNSRVVALEEAEIPGESLTLNYNGTEVGVYTPREETVFNLDVNGTNVQLVEYAPACGSTMEELALENDDTVSEAFGKIQKQITDNEFITAAALNDLDNRLKEVSGSTDGVLTVYLNDDLQGTYSPSADTALYLTAITKVTGADVLLTGYEISSGLTEDELLIKDTDNVNEAFGKIQKQTLDNELVLSTAINDLNRRILDITGGTGGDVTALSASVVTNRQNIQNLLGVTTAGVGAIKVNNTNDNINATTNKSISLAIANNEKVLSQDSNGLATTLGLSLDGNMLQIRGKNSEVVAEIDTTTFPGGDNNVQSDWNETDTTDDAYIKNKPTNISAFNNDAGYLTAETQLTSAVTGTGNVFTAIAVNNHEITMTKGMEVASSADTCAAIEKLSGDIVTEIIKNELTVAAMANDLHVSLNSLSAGTIQLSGDIITYIHEVLIGQGQWDPSILDDYYTKTEINNGVSASTSIVSGNLLTLSGVVYDHIHNHPAGGGVSDVKVNGTSVVDANGVAEVTVPAETTITASTTGTGNVITAVQTGSTKGHSLTFTKGFTAAAQSDLNTLSGAVEYHITHDNDADHAISAECLDHMVTFALSGECYGTATTNFAGDEVNINTYKKFTTGNSIANLDFAEYLTILRVSTGGTLTIASNGNLPVLPAGGLKEAHVIIENTSANEITIGINDARVKLSNGGTMYIGGGEIGELNAILTYDGSNYVIYVTIS